MRDLTRALAVAVLGIAALALASSAPAAAKSIEKAKPAVEQSSGGARDEATVRSPAPRAGGAAPDTATVTYPGSKGVLYTNGPIITHPGGGAGGADASALQTALSLNTYGFGDQFSAGNRVADDFTIGDPQGWSINTIYFLAYQTGSTTTSTITGVYLQIWDGSPDNPGSSVTFGDLTTNLMSATTWTNIYRVADYDLTTGTTRPVMASTAVVNKLLAPGTYWLDWTIDGSASYTGPWAPPITFLNQTNTGNAMQYTGAWGDALDTGTGSQQGFPFVIEGVIGHTPSPSPTPEGYKTPSPTPSPVPTASPFVAQVPFSDDFETWVGPGSPMHWTQEFVAGTTRWWPAEGSAAGGGAHSGYWNALLFYGAYDAQVNKLVTPQLDFGYNTNNPILTFWHEQPEWAGDTDTLRVYYKTSAAGAWNLLTSYLEAIGSWTQHTIPLPDVGDKYYIAFEGSTWFGYGVCVDDVLVSASPRPTATPTPSPTPQTTATPITVPSPSPTPSCGPDAEKLRDVIASGDYDGDGTAEIAIFRPSTILWSVQNLTRVYFGGSSDHPAPADYDGDGTAEIAIFRPAAGLWSVRGLTRAYYGATDDIPVSRDYEGNGTAAIGVFRESSGQWLIRDLTRFYFGQTDDWPAPGYYAGDGMLDVGVYRPGAGLWAVRGLTRAYFGQSDDWPVPADYAGDGTWRPTVFRPCRGMWALRDFTRVYFGNCLDVPRPADYDGNGTEDYAVFRGPAGFWSIRGLSRAYFGSSGDIPVTR